MYVCLSVSIYLSIYLSMYLCIYVSMYVCMDGWMYGWMYGCMDVWMYGWMYGCMDVWMYVCIYLSIYLCSIVSMYLCIYVSISAKGWRAEQRNLRTQVSASAISSRDTRYWFSICYFTQRYTLRFRAPATSHRGSLWRGTVWECTRGPAEALAN